MPNNFSPPIRSFFLFNHLCCQTVASLFIELSCENTRINRCHLLLQAKLRRLGILQAENKIKGIWNNGGAKINSSTTFFRSMLQYAHEIDDVSLSEWPDSLICTVITLQVWIFFFNLKKKLFNFITEFQTFLRVGRAWK